MKTSKKNKFFRTQLLSWHQGITRNLPWKDTHDPFKIWISEIILQQTRVDQGRDYYLRFIERFPTIQSLAIASEDEVLALWKGLGYYARARNLHAAAKELVVQHDAVFPKTYKEILKLKGIGPYTAAAIASFAFDEAHAVVDGNVYRVLSRFFGIDLPIDTTEGKKYFVQLADDCLAKEAPSAYNQAIMDFGAVQCTPVNPDCQICPMASDCTAFQNDTVADLPVKSKKINVRHRYFHFLFMRKADLICVVRRNEKDIWQGLYQLPLVESAGPIKSESVLKLISRQLANASELNATIKKVATKKQRLSHQMIHAEFYELSPSMDFRSGEWKSLKAVKRLGLPKLLSDFINEL